LTSAIALTFHGVTKEGAGKPNSGFDTAALRYAVTETRFVRSLDLLQSRQTCTAVEARRAAGGDWHILTFDDGLASDHALVFPVLAERGLRATFFVNSGNIGTSGYCTYSQLREMVQAGMEIGSHGCTHRYLVTIPRSEVLGEMKRSKIELEDRLGMAVTSFAPVGGHFRSWMLDAAEENGYTVFATMVPGRTPIPQENLLVLRRNHIQSEDSIDHIRRIFEADSVTLAFNRCRYAALYAAKRILGMRTYDLLKARFLGGAPEC